MFQHIQTQVKQWYIIPVLTGQIVKTILIGLVKTKKMKYLLTVILSITLSMADAYGQLLTREGHYDVHLGDYDTDFKKLDRNSLDSIENVLNRTLTYRSVDSLWRHELYEDEYPVAWHILMRMAVIDWQDKKYEAIDLLHRFSQTLLSGKSYLTLTNLDKVQKGGVTKADPVFYAFYAYWVMLKIDSDYSLKYINEVFVSENYILGSSIYQKKFMGTLLSFLSHYYKSDRVLAFCNENADKYAIQDSTLLSELNKKSHIARLKDENLSWDYLLSDDKRSLFSEKQTMSWYWNLVMFSDVYPNPNTAILIKKIENSKNYEDTYTLLYSLIWIVNGKLSNTKQEKTADIRNEAINTVNLIEKYYIDYGAKLRFTQGDIVKSCYEGIKHNLSKKN